VVGKREQIQNHCRRGKIRDLGEMQSSTMYIKNDNGIRLTSELEFGYSN